MTTKEQNKKERDRRTGREVAFGVQQTFACWLTDFIDPPVSRWFQNKFGDKHHHVTHKHVWYGEFAGDSAGFVSYMLAKRLLTRPVDATTRQVRISADPLLDWLGRRSLKPWAQKQAIGKDSPRYKKKLEEYKSFQAENIVDSAIVASSATGLNVASQKLLLHNHQPVRVILASKLIGAVTTVSLMLGLRTAVPTSMQSLDEELSERYFSRLVRQIRGVMGVGHTVSEGEIPEHVTNNATFDPDTKKGLWRMVAQHLRIYAPGEPQWTRRNVADEKRVLSAMADVFEKDSAFMDLFAKQHQTLIKKLYHNMASELEGAGAMASFAVSKKSVESIMHNRRNDLRQLAQALDDPKVRKEIADYASNSARLVYSRALSPRKQEALIASLLQPRESERGEPAVHIYANARGQMIEHNALACCFDPEGPLAKMLADELQRRLPEMEPAHLTAIAKNYISDRQHAALLTAEACQLDSAEVTEAVARSAALQQRHYSAQENLIGMTM